jgi:hypothetical protein
VPFQQKDAAHLASSEQEALSMVCEINTHMLFYAFSEVFYSHYRNESTLSLFTTQT